MKRIKQMSINATGIEIVDFLGNHPGYCVVIKGEEQTLTYQRVNNKHGWMKYVKCISNRNDAISFIEV